MLGVSRAIGANVGIPTIATQIALSEPVIHRQNRILALLCTHLWMNAVDKFDFRSGSGRSEGPCRIEVVGCVTIWTIAPLK